ncbi:MAG: Stk1 family PASTA domain-containing Ser/Thr kinase [Eubacteriales bacterium]
MEQRIINSKYAIHSIVGKGGMAIVYKGKNIETDEDVAVKMLKEEYLDNAEFISMFEKEAEISKVVDHKNVVKTIDVGIDKGCPYMVMEFVQGRTLKEYINMKGVLTEKEAVNISSQICDAIACAHEKKLVHRDIKSQNILIAKDGTVKVADFGIAKMTTSATMTMGGSNVLGSVHYMSPEQAMGNVIDKTTDIYSLGIVMYEMMTGTLPFKGDTPVTIALKHVNESLPSPIAKNHNMSKALDKIITKAASRLKDSRYQSASELKRDLELAGTDPYGDFVETADEAGETKEMPVIRAEQIKEYLENAAKEKQEQKENASKEITDIGLYETNSLNPINQDTIHEGIAVAKIRKVVTWVVIMILVIVGGLLGLSRFFNNQQEKDRNDQKFMVPDVEQKLADEATRIIKLNGFDYTIEYAANEEYAEGVVISQSPKGGQLVDNSIVVKLTISQGPELFEVPNVLNISFTESIAIIEDAGFSVGDVSQEVSDIPNEYVVRQEPKAGSEIPIGEKINIWIATQQDTTIPIMPNIIGRTLVEAQYLLDSVDVDKDRIDVIPVDSGFEKDIVIYHEPEMDTVIDDTQRIVLYVSNGEEEKYSIEKHFLLSLTAQTTQIRIEYIDEGVIQVVYNKTLTKGDHDITLTLYTNTPGDKEIIIYYDGVEARRDRATFEVQD